MSDAFHIFLSVGKTYLVKTKADNQRLDQPSVLVTASTGKAAANINSITLHFAFHLPVKQGFYVQPGAEVLHILRSRYAYFKILLIDEISMTGLETFNHLNKALQVIKRNTLPFNEIYFLVIGDFL